MRKTRVPLMMAALGIGLSIGWVLPAQQPAPVVPQWAEKEPPFYEAFTAAKDDKGRLTALEAWEKAFPDSKLWLERGELFLNTHDAMKDYRKLVDRAKSIRAKAPGHYLSTVHLIQKIPMLAASTAADHKLAEDVGRQVMDEPEKVFALANKPAGLTDAQWSGIRPEVTGIARTSVLWSLGKQNDRVKLEAEYRRAVKDEPTQPGYSYNLGQTIYDPKLTARHPEVIFHWAHAISDTGKNAFAAAQKTQIEASVKKLYTVYHGSEEGLPDVMELARNNAFPPADFKIVDRVAIAKAEADEKQAWIDAHPMQAWWRDVMRADLTGPTAAAEFAAYEGTLLPVEAMGFTHFKGKIISMTPVDKPKEVVVAVFDPNVADAKLVFTDGAVADKGIGDEILFKGSPKSFQKEPFLVTFDMDTVEGSEVVGWKSVAPAPAKAAPKGAKGGAKGKGSAKGKGGK